MKHMLQQLQQQWNNLADRARSLLLKGFITLKDALFITKKPAMDADHLDRWIEKNRRPRHQWLIDRAEWVQYALDGFDALRLEIESMVRINQVAVLAFLQGKLTLAQMRYAVAKKMGVRRLNFFAQLNQPKRVAERRGVHRKQVAEAALHRAGVSADEAETILGNMPHEHLLVYAHARTRAPQGART